MLAQVATVVLDGMRVLDVAAQVHLSNGNPNLTIVGLADKAIMESRERIRAAINSLGLSLPAKRITVNLAPASLTKNGSHFDLPIALAILVAMKIIPDSMLQNYIVVGELFLNGSIGAISSVLPIAIHANSSGLGIICPHDNGPEAVLAGMSVPVLASRTLLQLIHHIRGENNIFRPEPMSCVDKKVVNYYDFSQIKFQESAKRALKIAIVGGHNILLTGVPGTGKSMLANSAATLLPPLSDEEVLEVSVIHSMAGMLQSNKIITRERPYRSPHHSASMAAIVGGGNIVRPGEITLAHNGILFLDELPEFQRSVLDALRQPMETGKVHIARADTHVTYPANFQLIAAMNPCKCGYFGCKDKECNKAPNCSTAYKAKISGPILERIDIHVTINSNTSELFDLSNQEMETSATVLNEITNVRLFQKDIRSAYGVETNAKLANDAFEKFCFIEDLEAKALIQRCANKFHWSMRGYTRVMRVARTIADMEFSPMIKRHHIAEAITYRSE